MGGKCGYNGREEKSQRVSDGNMNERDHLEDLGVDGRVLKWIFKTRNGGTCSNMAQNRESWRALVNASMNIRVPYKAGNFLSGRGTVSLSRRILLHGVSHLVT
jgi:hypothetical protein